MTRDEILSAIRREHMNFLMAIGGIPDDSLENEPVAEEWTIKDLMAHIALWMRVAGKFIAEYQQDGSPKRLGLKDAAAINAFNAAGWEARRELPLAKVIQEFQAAYQDLIAGVESLSDAQLSAQLPAPWDEGDTLEKLIAVNSYQHEPEHTQRVSQWRAELEEEDE